MAASSHKVVAARQAGRIRRSYYSGRREAERFRGMAAAKAGDKFELLHSNDLDEMALATPALVGDRLLLHTENRLYSIRKKS